MAVVRGPLRGDVYLMGLDPTMGTEIKKTRPCLVVSPDELNQHLRTVDTTRLVKKLGRLSSAATTEALDTLREMFTE